MPSAARQLEGSGLRDAIVLRRRGRASCDHSYGADAGGEEGNVESATLSKEVNSCSLAERPDLKVVKVADAPKITGLS